MRLFTYTFKGETLNSVVLSYMDGGICRYRVTLGNNIWLTITPAAIPGKDSKAIWVQSNKHGELPQRHDLVQALGQGLEDAGIGKEDK